MYISKISVKRPTIVVVIFSILIILGLVAYRSLNYELMPEFSPPYISVVTIYPGAAPSEVETAVTEKIEDAVSSLEHMNSMQSISLENVSIVTLELRMAADVNEVVQEAQRKVNAVVQDLPEMAREPSISTFAFDEFPIMKIGVRGDLKGSRLFDLIESRVIPSISRIDGVAEVGLLGGKEREIRVNVQQERLQKHGISLVEVNQAIQRSNLDFPTGKIKDADQEMMLRISGKFTSLEQIREVMVRRTPEGGIIRVGDLAEVMDTVREQEVLVRLNGEEAIGLNIKKQSDANAVAVSRQVREALEDLEATYRQQGLHFIIGLDSTEFTLEAVEAVNQDLFNAILLVALVMLVFLHSFRSALMVMVSIPASLISTFIALQIFGFTLNLMTLLSLSLVVGVLVDDSIIVLENIYRHLKMGKKMYTAVMDAVREIGLTVISTTGVLVIVFLPLALSGGIVSMLLRQFSIVIVVATILSSFVALMIIPALASRFSRIRVLNPSGWFDRLFLVFEKHIDRAGEKLVGILTWSFRNPGKIFMIATVSLVLSISLIPLGFIGDEFINIGDRGEFIIELEYPGNTTLEENDQMTREIERYLMGKQEIVNLFTTIGITSNVMTGQSSSYLTEINAILVNKKDRDQSTNVYARLIKHELESRFPGVQVRSVPSSLIGTADDAPIMVVVSAPDNQAALAFGRRLLERISAIPGTMEEKLSIKKGEPVLSIQVDREKAHHLGLDIGRIGAGLQAGFAGNRDARFRQGDTDYDIFIRLDDFDRRNQNDVKAFTVMNDRGELIRMDQVAGISEMNSPSRLERKDRMASVTLQAQAIGRAPGNIGSDIRDILSKMEVPQEVSISFEGDLKFQEDAFGSMGLAFLISILFVYLIMVALYDSYLHPFVVMFSIPLSIIGALMMLALAHQNLSVFSLLGMIMLIGLVAKNTILIVDFTNELRKQGYGIPHALLTASRLRLRPILMTALSMIIALFPIALATGAGAEWKNGLAWVLIGGLSSSLILSLVVVPLMYLVMENARSGVKQLLKKLNPGWFRLRRKMARYPAGSE